jgi:hypothetical protein
MYIEDTKDVRGRIENRDKEARVDVANNDMLC